MHLSCTTVSLMNLSLNWLKNFAFLFPLTITFPNFVASNHWQAPPSTPSSTTSAPTTCHVSFGSPLNFDLPSTWRERNGQIIWTTRNASNGSVQNTVWLWWDTTSMRLSCMIQMRADRSDTIVRCLRNDLWRWVLGRFHFLWSSSRSRNL